MFLVGFHLDLCLVLYDQWCYGFPYSWTLNGMKCECIWLSFVFWKWYLFMSASALEIWDRVWPCGRPKRYNVTREGDPQGGDGRVGRRGEARWGGPSPLCGGGRRRGVFRWGVPLVHWELISSERLLCCCCLLLVFGFRLLLDCFVGYFTMLLEYLFMSFVGYLIPWLEYWFMSSVSIVGTLDLLILWFIIWELVGVHIWDEPMSWLVVLVLEYGCDGGLLSYYWLWTIVLLLTVDYWVTIDFWLWTSVPVIGLITPVIGLLPLWLDCRSLWLDFGPCDWAHHPCLTRDSWLLTCDMWFDLVRWLVWLWLGDWSWEIILGGLLWVLCVIRLVSCGSRWVGCFLWIVFSWYLVYGSLLPYAFVVENWLYLTESWLLIRSVYPCWVSICTVEQFVGVYILYGCVNLFTSLCIPIFPCGCEWWLLSILLLMVLRVFSRYGVVTRERVRAFSIWGW